MNVLQRIQVGVDLMSHSRRAWGTERFWDVIGWWHGEVHYTIPRIEEEKRVAREMERSFVDTSNWVIGSYQHVRPNISTDAESLSMCVPDQVGYWDWNGIKIGSNARPNPLRHALIGFLLGAKWVDEETKKNRAEPGPEYGRLAEFLASLQP